MWMRVGVLRIRRLHAGGLNLGYRCSSRCRHCLYACGPHRRDGAGKLEPVLDALAERAPHAVYHVGGGEPFLDRDLLAAVLDGFHDRGLNLDYVETNASWVRGQAHARRVLEECRGRGLRGLLISVSLFHAEFVPPGRTLDLVDAAYQVFPRGVIVWLPHFLRLISAMERDERLDLTGLIDEKGDRLALEIGLGYGLIPGGRAGRYLARHGKRTAWDAIERPSCLERLENSTHFHVDLEGNYVPGLCGGIVLPLDAIPGDVPLGDYPLLDLLVRGGPTGLARWAMRTHDFEPDPQGYSGACDLCTHVRLHVHGLDDFKELGPLGFYDSRSVDGYG
jgi:hypothetical protein